MRRLLISSAIGVALVIASAAVLLRAPSPAYSPAAARVNQNTTIAINTPLTAGNGRFRFINQSDGNVVLYDSSSPIWVSNTIGQGKTLIMQGDGNLVDYNAAGQAVWAADDEASSYFGFGYQHLLSVQDDGNIVIYAQASSGLAPMWATNTARVKACPAGDPLAGVHDPQRLIVVSRCATVSGTVACVYSDPSDGDTHFALLPDSQYQNLLTPGNAVWRCGSDSRPRLVVEIIPQHCGAPLVSNCADIGKFDDPPVPVNNAHITVTGPLTHDTAPNMGYTGWSEIHPAYSIQNS